MKLKSSEPFWLVKNGIIHSYPSLREDIETDVLVIGGGITGSLIAHQCIRDGYKTILIDRREIGHGSTSATTSMLQYEIDKPLYQLIEQIGEAGAVASYQACSGAIDKLAHIAMEVRSHSGFRKKNSLYFAAFKKDMDWLRREYNTRAQYGFPVKWLSPGAITEAYGIHNTYGGILSAQGGSMDAFRLTHDILVYNISKGLRVYDKTDTIDTVYKKSGVVVTTEYGNTIRAGKLIYCNGYESTEIIKESFVKLLSTYAIVSEADAYDPGPLADTLVWNTAAPYIYMRHTDDNRLLIGGGDVDFVSASKRDRLLAVKAGMLERRLKKYFPHSDFRTDFIWAGTFGETKDGLPYIGAHPDFPGTYFVLGFGGNGITFSAIGMEIVSCLLRQKRHPLEPYFRFGR